MAEEPPLVHVKNTLNMNKFLKKLGESRTVDKHLQAKVYKVTREKYLDYYQKSYQSLVRQIIQHLEHGFDGALTGGTTILLQNPMTGNFESIRRNWNPLTAKYQQRKARYFQLATQRDQAYSDALEAFKDGNAKAAKGHRRKTKFKPADRATFGSSTATKYWIFRRNLEQAISSTPGFSVDAATVTMSEKVTRRGGILVSGKDKATIRYDVTLKFGKLASPLDDMVRKPFMTGDPTKSRVWDNEYGPSNRVGIHVLALVEAKRPFIVDLSAQMGRMVRRSLKFQS